MAQVFVLQGDLVDLACDAVLVPVDDQRRVVRRHWAQLVPEGNRRPSAVDGWDVIDDGPLPDHDGRRVRLVVGTSPDGTAEGLAARVTAAVQDLAAEGLEPRRGRALPLVALPLVGTGAGGFQRRRGAVVRALLAALEALATDVDVALVLRTEQDYQAVQAQRRGTWAALTAEQLAAADRLGRLAGRGGLSLFLGAGVSYPAGAPLWRELIAAIALATGQPVPDGGDEIAQATALEQGSREALEGVLTNSFGRLPVAPGHALLASLRCRQVVTTNYDRCYERALDGMGEDSYRVLARELPAQPAPYVLKLHGDVREPSSIVLTQQGYDRVNKGELRALASVVDALLHTSHLLFVGYSLKDRTFVESVQRVAAVRRVADPDLAHPFATVLALHPGMVSPTPGMDVVSMTEADDRAAGRLLEVFLDRVAWTAARVRGWTGWMMQPAYEDLLTEGDRHLVEDVRRLLPHLQGSSKGRSAVAELLRALGHREGG